MPRPCPPACLPACLPAVQAIVLAASGFSIVCSPRVAASPAGALAGGTRVLSSRQQQQQQQQQGQHPLPAAAGAPQPGALASWQLAAVFEALLLAAVP